MGLSVKLLKKVKGFTLDVEWEIGNELAILFGGSGSGKSMTLQLIAGLMEPDEGFIRSNGSIFFDKTSGINISPQHRSLGYVFQDRVLFPHMTVKENIAYGLKGESGSQKRGQKVKEMIKLFHLQGLEDMVPSEISGGQKQRVALARALIGRPKALLLDEPFSALDNTLRLEMRRLLEEIRAEFEIAVVLVTHDTFEAYSMGDSIIVYSSGRVEQVGRTDDVFRRPKSRKVAQSLGAKNLYKAKVLGRDESFQRVILGVNGLQFYVPQGLSQETVESGTEVDLFIRPEEVMIIREGKPVKDSLKRNIFEGQILDILDRGRYHMVYFQTLEGKIPFEISIPNYAFRNLNLLIGGMVKVALREECLWVMP
jgi:molybdate transport system ATP-binding protein